MTSLQPLWARLKWVREIHIVLDNLSAHEIKAVGEFLDNYPKLRFQFTPTYSSSLNQVEFWFVKVQRPIARGVFSSVADLVHKLRNTFVPMRNQICLSAGRIQTQPDQTDSHPMTGT